MPKVHVCDRPHPPTGLLRCADNERLVSGPGGLHKHGLGLTEVLDT